MGWRTRYSARRATTRLARVVAQLWTDARQSRLLPATADLRRRRGTSNVGSASQHLRGFGKTDYRAMLDRWLTNVPRTGVRRGQRGRATRGAACHGVQPQPHYANGRCSSVTPAAWSTDERRGNRVRDGVRGAWPRRSSHRHSPRGRCTVARSLASYPAALDAAYGGTSPSGASCPGDRHVGD